MNEYGALVEGFWQGNTKLLEGSLPHCHFIHHTPHIDWPDIENGPPPSKDGDKPPESGHSLW